MSTCLKKGCMGLLVGVILTYAVFLSLGLLFGLWRKGDFLETAIYSEFWRVPLRYPYEIADFHNQGNASLNEWQKNAWRLHGIKTYAMTTNFVFGEFNPYKNNCSTGYDNTGRIVSEEFTWGSYYNHSGKENVWSVGESFARTFDQEPSPYEERSKMYFVFSFKDKSLRVFDNYSCFIGRCVEIGVDYNTITVVQAQWTNHWKAYYGGDDAKKR